MRAHAFLWIALLAVPAVQAAENRNLAEARKRVARQQWPEALEELQAAEQLPGNSPRHLAEVAALRASALLGEGPSAEHTQQARDELLRMFHLDDSGGALEGATPAAKSLAQDLQASHALLRHERLGTARTGRPQRHRAPLEGPVVGAPNLTLHYGVEGQTDEGDWIVVAMDPAGARQYEAWLRPGVGGVPRGGERRLRYFLEARGTGGELLDSNGSAREPIRASLSETLPETSGLAALDEGGKAAHPPPPPPPPTPWYRRWEIVGPIGGALVLGGVVAAVLLQARPQPIAGSLGRVDLP